MLIGILGRKGHGKDTIADYLVVKYGFKKTAVAKPLKDITKILFGFTDEQLYDPVLKEVEDSYWKVKPRVVLQYLGTEIMRNKISEIIPWVGGNFWLELLQKNVNVNDKTVVCDIRYENELNWIHQNNGQVIKIVRPNIPGDDHEKNIDILVGDFLINNDSNLDDLYAQVDRVMNVI